MLWARRTTNIGHDDLVAEEVPGPHPVRLIAKYAFVGKDLDELAALSVMPNGGRNIEANDLVDHGRIHFARLRYK